jgi:hypothetical protein
MELLRLFHWTTGLPFSIFSGGEWSTNYNLKGEAIEIGNPGPVGVHMDSQGNPTMFQNPSAAIAAFRHPYRGESGQHNELRGPGYFGIDTGIAQRELPLRTAKDAQRSDRNRRTGTDNELMNRK